MINSIFMAIATVDQTPPVLDISGQALQAGVSYYIKPASIDKGGPFELLDRAPFLCPLYVAQEINGSAWPFHFQPFFKGETVVRESRDQQIISGVSAYCWQSISWSIEKANPENQRKLIVMQKPARGKLPTGKYFRISRSQPEVDGNSYTLSWCPTDLCPTCEFTHCGPIGYLNSNGKKRFLALNGSALPVVFERIQQ